MCHVRATNRVTNYPFFIFFNYRVGFKSFATCAIPVTHVISYPLCKSGKANLFSFSLHDVYEYSTSVICHKKCCVTVQYMYTMIKIDAVDFFYPRTTYHLLTRNRLMLCFMEFGLLKKYIFSRWQYFVGSLFLMKMYVFFVQPSTCGFFHDKSIFSMAVRN